MVAGGIAIVLARRAVSTVETPTQGIATAGSPGHESSHATSRDYFEDELSKLRAFVLQLRLDNVHEHERLAEQDTRVLGMLGAAEAAIRGLEVRLAAMESRQTAALAEAKRARELAHFAVVRLSAEEELPSGDLIFETTD